MPTALITGATAGIGAAFTRALAARGLDLVLVARDGARLEAAAAQLRAAHGVGVEVMAADLTDRAQLQRVADRAGSREAPVDLLVNNAGFGLGGAYPDTEVTDEERMLDVLCRAVLVVTQPAVVAMRERGHGTIITVSSVAGFAPLGTYAAAKAWATTFTESVSVALRGTGVTAMALCPGYVRTEFHERAALDVGERRGPAWLDADALVAAALADARRGVVVSVPSAVYTGAVIALRLLPRWIVRAAAAGRARLPPSGR